MIQEPKFLSAEQFLLTTLVVKLAVVALLATMLVRYRRFRHILIFERRAWRDRAVFAFSIGIPLSLGVASRILLNYNAADLTLEGPYLVGLIAGPYAGAFVGLMAAGPAIAVREWIALPFAIGCGFAGGGLREVCPKEAIWHFSPFVFADLPRHAWRTVRKFTVDWQVILLVAPVALGVLRQGLGMRFGQAQLFYLPAPAPWLIVMVLLATVLAVATPIKIWNNARIEHRLQEQETLLMAAKIEALKNQINPHFLFNTLASISSLIRTQPEKARTVITKLSAMLRRQLRTHEHFVTLREELQAIDEYLDIEQVRFGPNLRVEKAIGPDTLDVIVPSMLLQPLVENSVKHGLSRKLGPGRITIRSVRDRGVTILEVIDDGVGISEDRLAQPTSGIGLSNVRERLRVIYGAHCQLKLTSEPGKGTCARMEIPELAVAREASA